MRRARYAQSEIAIAVKRVVSVQVSSEGQTARHLNAHMSRLSGVGSDAVLNVNPPFRR